MIRRLLQRLHQFWFDGGTGDCAADDEMLREYRLTRRLTERLGIAEDPRVRREFDAMERESRTLRGERRR